MTVVVARKFGERMLVCGDTMVTHHDKGRREAVPGKLKVVVLGENVTAAYAGAIPQGPIAIREARSALLETGRMGEAIEILVRWSSELPLDFLLAIHDPRPKILKIRNGKLIPDADGHWIGDPKPLQILDAIFEREKQRPAEHWDESYGSPEERAFLNAFVSLFVENGTEITPGVGGFPTASLSSPFGHSYLSLGFQTSWDRISLPNGQTDAQRYDQDTGLSSLSVNVIAPAPRGQALLGIYMPQPQIGYIHDPLVHEDPAVRRAVSLGDFADEMNQIASMIQTTSSSLRVTF